MTEKLQYFTKSRLFGIEYRVEKVAPEEQTYLRWMQGVEKSRIAVYLYVNEKRKFFHDAADAQIGLLFRCD